jgi:hypothetical protein
LHAFGDGSDNLIGLADVFEHVRQDDYAELVLCESRTLGVHYGERHGCAGFTGELPRSNNVIPAIIDSYHQASATRKSNSRSAVAGPDIENSLAFQGNPAGQKSGDLFPAFSGAQNVLPDSRAPHRMGSNELIFDELTICLALFPLHDHHVGPSDRTSPVPASAQRAMRLHLTVHNKCTTHPKETQ